MLTLSLPEDDQKLEHVAHMLLHQQVSEQVNVAAKDILTDLAILPPMGTQARIDLVSKHIWGCVQAVLALQEGRR